jgi:hypothetical protein
MVERECDVDEEKFSDDCVVERDSWGGLNIMVWGGIGRTRKLGPNVFQILVQVEVMVQQLPNTSIKFLCNILLHVRTLYSSMSMPVHTRLE